MQRGRGDGGSEADGTEPSVGLRLTNCEITTWPKSDAQPTELPRCPQTWDILEVIHLVSPDGQH